MTFRDRSQASSWYLAFDSGCDSCTSIAGRVGEIAGDRLEVVGLLDPRVQELRALAFEDEPPWVPTLIRVGEDPRHVRAWTGPRLAMALVRRLGLRRTLRVSRALRQLQHDAPDLERRRLLKVAPGSVLGLLAFAGAGVTGTALATRGGGLVTPRVRRARHLGDDAQATRAVRDTLISVGRETPGSSALTPGDFAWQHAELIEYGDGTSSVVVPAKPRHQTDVERLFLLASYDVGENQSNGVLLQRFKRSDQRELQSYAVDFETLDQEPIVGFQVDEREQRMRKVIHDLGRRRDESTVLAAPEQPVASHNYWHCVQNCLANAWDNLPWWLQGACFISCGGCIWGGNIFGCSVCVGCLGGYAYGCTVTLC